MKKLLLLSVIAMALIAFSCKKPAIVKTTTVAGGAATTLIKKVTVAEVNWKEP